MDVLYQPVEDLLPSNSRENAHLALVMLNAHILRYQAAHDFDGGKVMGFLHHVEGKALRDGGSYMVPLWNDFLFNVAYWGILSHPGVSKALHNLLIDNLVTDRKMAGALLRGRSLEGILLDKTASPHWATVCQWGGMRPPDQSRPDARRIFENMSKKESVDEILAFSALAPATTSLHLLVWHADEWFNSMKPDERLNSLKPDDHILLTLAGVRFISLKPDERESENIRPVLEKIVAIATFARQESLRNCGCNDDLPWFDTWIGRDCDVLHLFSQRNDTWHAFMELVNVVAESVRAGHITGSAANGILTLHRLLTEESTSFLRYRTPLLRLLCTDFKYTASAFRHALRLDVLSWSLSQCHGTVWFIDRWLRSPSLADWIMVGKTRNMIIGWMASMIGTAIREQMKNCGYNGDFPWISTFAACNHWVARLFHQHKSYGWPRLWDSILEAEKEGLLTVSESVAREIPLLWRLAHASESWRDDQAFDEGTARKELSSEIAQSTPLPPPSPPSSTS